MFVCPSSSAACRRPRRPGSRRLQQGFPRTAAEVALSQHVGAARDGARGRHQWHVAGGPAGHAEHTAARRVGTGGFRQPGGKTTAAHVYM